MPWSASCGKCFTATCPSTSRAANPVNRSIARFQTTWRSSRSYATIPWPALAIDCWWRSRTPSTNRASCSSVARAPSSSSARCRSRTSVSTWRPSASRAVVCSGVRRRGSRSMTARVPSAVPSARRMGMPAKKRMPPPRTSGSSRKRRSWETSGRIRFARAAVVCEQRAIALGVSATVTPPRDLNQWCPSRSRLTAERGARQISMARPVASSNRASRKASNEVSAGATPSRAKGAPSADEVI